MEVFGAEYLTLFDLTFYMFIVAKLLYNLNVSPSSLGKNAILSAPNYDRGQINI